jgi:response regulator of citrate/malate metabolism
MTFVPLDPTALRGITYERYVDAIGQGEIVSRSMMAERMGVSYTTAQYHLDRAVQEGELNRAYGYIGRQPGWVYAHASDMPRLKGIDDG